VAPKLLAEGIGRDAAEKVAIGAQLAQRDDGKSSARHSSAFRRELTLDGP